MAQQLTIKQIAALAGVSVGTVDRVLHNRGRVSQEALNAVQAVLDTQEYKYNIHTSAVAFKKTRKVFKIVVTIPFSEKGEYWDLIKAGIDKAFSEYSDISISSEFVFFDQFNSLSCKEAFSSITHMNCSAVIIGTTFVDETRDLCSHLDKKGIPYAFVDGRVSETKPVAIFTADQSACGRLLARLMDGLTPEGSEIAVLLPRRVGTQMSNNSSIRLAAFKEYFHELGKDCLLKELHFSTDNEENTHKEISNFIQDNPEIKGIAVVISNGYLVSDSLASADIKGICVGGFDVTSGNARCIQEGTLDFLINQHPERQGFQAVESTLHYLLYGVADKTQSEYLPIDIVFKENLQFWQDNIM